jgi:hypothetical protein
VWQSAVMRRIFICATTTEDKCCDRADGRAAWEFLKRRLKKQYGSHFAQNQLSKNIGFF